MSYPKQLSIEAKKIFTKILNQLGTEDYLKINVNGPDPVFMPVTVEKLGEYTNALGTGFELSLAHYYEQHGDLMRDPETVFFVVDNRTAEQPGTEWIGVWPVEFTQDNMGLYYRCIKQQDGKTVFNARQQSDLTTFCNQWLKNIKYQQEIK